MEELENSSKSRTGGATRNSKSSKIKEENAQPKDSELPMTAMNGPRYVKLDSGPKQVKSKYFLQ